ncbi:NIPSNAP family protein [Ochrobactrum sp. Marseille-Q0166]|uniref:NIPSNAP family protein n=1 Tax=Ochrobactrum sp. Marseille-Q0166 TaxID=2761105 RepID=UPI0016551DA8|nr:NIPSNAP family protein [Ochrobactrum sp. Marseille-Q0166]MBC8718678.1 NIPSNAP family protein [Ochrobactrum sp. Marseille-Q0166]
MQRYEIATLSTTLGAAAKAAPAIESFAKEGKGKLLGIFYADIGLLNQLFVLRGFDTVADYDGERERTLRAANPFGSAEWLTSLDLEGYAPFPFLPPVEVGSFGPAYEFRTYVLKTGGLEPTIKAWEAAVPARTELSKLTICMYGIDGKPRMTHIWPFASVNDRGNVRAVSVSKGVWPPKGGPDWLTNDMRSTIAFPTANSPLK